MLEGNKISLGISIGERSLCAAEVKFGGGGAAPIARTAEFVYPSGVNLQDPSALGSALAEFLKFQGMTARKVRIGIPAKWLVLSPYEMPPTDLSTAREALWLQAVQKTSQALGDMAFDFVGQPSPTASANLLIIGLQRLWITRLLSVAEAAGLKAISIGPMASAVASATSRHAQDAMIASFNSEGAELISQENAQTRWIGHVRMNGSIPTAVSQMRRAMAGMAPSDDPQTDKLALYQRPQRNLVLWDSFRTEPAMLEALRGSVKMDVMEATSDWLGVKTADTRGLSEIAVALPSADDRINFLRPRITEPTTGARRLPGHWQAWAAAAVLVLGLPLADAIHIHRQYASADGKLQAIAGQLAIATPYVQSMKFAEGFSSSSPKYLRCLSDVTDAIGPDGQINLTAYNLDAEMRGEFTGRAPASQAVLALRDKLSSTGKFIEINCKLDTAGGRGPGETSFSMTFRYLPGK